MEFVFRRQISKLAKKIERSLIGKVHGEKHVSYRGLKNTMTGIWSIRGELRVWELGPNIFQFIFPSKQERQKVTLGRAWTFDGQFLVLRNWEETVQSDREGFRFAQCWIQVWDILNNWVSKEVGWKMGRLFRKTHDVIIPEIGSPSGRHIKVLVDIDLWKALPGGTKLKEGDQCVWISFRYEQLSIFCNYCGTVGHGERLCNKRKTDINSGQLKGGQYGDWMRVAVTRSRKKESTTKVTTSPAHPTIPDLTMYNQENHNQES